MTMGKRVFLSGGTGFIGRNMIEQLGGKHDISAPGRGELDMLDAAAVERYLKTNDFDVVVHAANIGGNKKDPGPQNMAELNMRMFFNLARCSGSFGRMVHFGSGAEYGKQEPIVMAKEEDFGWRMPADSYGFYKYVCSKHIEKADNITCLRIFGCYGKYEDYDYKFISNAICRALLGMPIKIANRNVRFSYIHIDDFVRIVDHFIGRGGKHRFYNATPDEAVDLLSIAEAVKEAAGGGPEIAVKNPGMGPEYTGSNARLRQELGEFRFTPMKEGVAKLYEWYKNNKGNIDRGRVEFLG